MQKLWKHAVEVKLPGRLREEILDHGFSKTTALSSWKHTATHFDSIDDLKGVHVIFCVRHPASWVLGLSRKSYHIWDVDFDDLYSFLQVRWKTVKRERLNEAVLSATETYNAKLKSYAALQDKLTQQDISFSIVRHEDFAVDQEKVFSQLAPYLEQPADVFSPLEASTKDKGKTADYYRSYYGENLWLKDVDQRSLDQINSEIDWAQIHELGYTPL